MPNAQERMDAADPNEAPALELPKAKQPFAGKLDPGKQTQASTPNPDTANSQTAAGHSFNLNEFLLTESTGVKVDQETGKKESSLENKTVNLNEDITRQYTTFLENHLTILSKLDPKILKNNSHLHELRLLQELTTDGKPDNNKINEFFNTPKGWILTTMILEQQAAMKFFALGLDGSVDPMGLRNTMADELTIKTGEGQGALNKLYDKVKPILAKVGWAISGDALTHTIGRSLQNGVTIDIKQCAVALKALKSMPQEAAYLKAFGIDINDYELSPDESLVKPRTLSNGEFYRTMDPNHIRNELIGALYTREEFYTSLGIPPSKLDALPTQFLTQQDTNQPEQTRTHWQQEVLRKFKPTGDPAKDIKAYMQANRQVVLSVLESYVREKQTKADREDSYLKTLEDKKQGMESGSLLQAKQEDLTKEKGALEADSTSLKNDQEGFQKQKNALDVIAKNQLELQNITGGKSPDDYIKGLEEKLDLNNPHSILAQRRELVEQKYNKILSYLNQYTNPKVREKIAPQVEADYNRVYKEALSVLDEQAAEVTAKIAKVKELVSKAQSDEQSFSQNTPSADGSTPLSDTYKKDFADLTTYGITEKDLRNKSLEEILSAVNDFNTQNPTMGWAKEKNLDPAIRTKVYRAMIEAKVRTAPHDDYDTMINTWHLTDNELLTMSFDQLLAETQRRSPVAATPPRNDEIRRAQQQAKERMEKLIKSLEAANKDVTNNIEAKNKEIENVSFGKELGVVNTALDLLQRRQNIYENTYLITENIKDYTEVGNPSTTDATFADYEKNLPKGYLAFMEYLFAYNEHTPREEYFRQITNVLPPEKLAEVFANALGIKEKKDSQGNIVAKKDNLGMVLGKIKTGSQRGTISTLDITMALKQVINGVRSEALAVI